MRDRFVPSNLVKHGHCPRPPYRDPLGRCVPLVAKEFTPLVSDPVHGESTRARLSMLSVLPFAGQAHESLRVHGQLGELRFAE